jgi:hypothetical protein
MASTPLLQLPRRQTPASAPTPCTCSSRGAKEGLGISPLCSYVWVWAVQDLHGGLLLHLRARQPGILGGMTQSRASPPCNAPAGVVAAYLNAHHLGKRRMGECGCRRPGSPRRIARNCFLNVLQSCRGEIGNGVIGCCGSSSLSPLLHRRSNMSYVSHTKR